MNDKPTRVLLIEDNCDDVAIMEHYLADTPGWPERFLVRSALRLSSGRRLLAQDDFDVVLLALRLPYCAELEAFLKVREQRPRLAVVVLCGFKDEALARRAVEMGAQDYLIKGTLSAPLLRHVIRNAIEKAGLQSEARSGFLQGFCHELRSPLTTVQLALACLREEKAGPLTERQSKIIDAAARSATLQAKMLESALETPRPEPEGFPADRIPQEISPARHALLRS
ncbi:MAG TPA: response regulator [Elusimicrobiota bacterium]|nr:response regulator [Elusimicrobiota bacterium]